EKFLMELSAEIGAEWQLIFFDLGLTNPEVERIDMDYQRSQTKILKALLLWRHKQKEKTASEQMRLLLRGLKTQRKDLAEKYEAYLGIIFCYI
ncbi:hypothetical protein FSP39_012044, partial [Pinctada imbricata]